MSEAAGWRKTVAKFVDTASIPGNNFAAGRHDELSASETAHRSRRKRSRGRRETGHKHEHHDNVLLARHRDASCTPAPMWVRGPQCASSSAALSFVCARVCMCERDS